MAVQKSGLGFVGQSVTRVEDERLLTGEGTFVADVQPTGVLHAVFVRSPFPHATITSIDTTEASMTSGVVKVFTGAQINAITNPLLPVFMLDGLYTPLVTAISEDRVRHVGDPVAVVIAETRYIAEDAAELVTVEYEQLPPVPNITTALDSTSTPLWDKAEGNVLYDYTDNYGDIDAVFAKAERVITESFSCQRQSNQPMETRGSVVEVDKVTGHLTIHNTSQAPHLLKWVLAASTVRDGGLKSFRSFYSNKERRKNFLTAAKEFRKTNKDKIAQQDNRGPRSQLKKDRSLLKHMGKMAFGLMAAEDFPTVKSVDIGGGFGSKGSVAREDVALVAAATELGRSVQWIEDRVENLTDGGQAREEDFTMSIAVDDDGTLRAMKCDAIIDHGAYPGFPIGAAATKQLWKVYMPGSYNFEAFQLRTRIVTTNKGKHVPYRGPWANETWVRERMIDVVANKLGLSPIEVRQKNMIDDDKLPMPMITGPTMDVTMSAKKTLDHAITMIDFGALAKDKTEAVKRGNRIGIGIATYHEAAPGPPNFFESVNPGSDMFIYEDGRATIEANGSIVMYTSQVPHGQSHQTTYKQVVADEFGVAMGDVEIVWGDTDRSQFSFLGTGGSRGGPLGAGVMKYTAREIREEVIELAAEMLEASPTDITVAHGNIHVAGVPSKGITYSDVARRAAENKGVSEGPVFEAEKKYMGHGDGGWSCATHVAIVDIDLDTGLVSIPKYLVVEDCGPIINPAIVDGQVRGGVAQGIGAVFYENLHYDDDANLLSTTYMDYLIPTAMEIPEIEIEHLETLSPGENDARGVGEGGMIGAPAALTNAVSDALGVIIKEQHLPPARILELAKVIEPDG